MILIVRNWYWITPVSIFVTLFTVGNLKDWLAMVVLFTIQIKCYWWVIAKDNKKEEENNGKTMDLREEDERHSGGFG